MNRTTTLVLALAVAAVAVIVVVVSEGENPLGPVGEGGRARILLPDLLAADIASVVLEDPAGGAYPSPVRVERAGAGWRATCKAIQGGRRVRARAARMNQMLETLQALTSLRVAGEAREGDLARYGLAAGQFRRLSLKLKDGGSVELRAGASIEPAGILVMFAGGEQVHVVDESVGPDLFPRLDSIWDNQLLPLDATAVTRLVLRPTSGEPMELVREFAAWRVRRPFEGRGDTRRCDLLRNNLLGLGIVRYLDRKALKPRDLEPRYIIEVETRDPPARMELRLCASSPQGVLAVVETEPDPVLVSADVIAWLRHPPSWFRDRRLLRLGDHPVLAVRISAAGHDLEIMRNKKRLEVNGGARRAHELPAVAVQPEQWEEFYRRLGSLEALRFDAGSPETAGWLTLSIRQSRDGEAPLERTLRIGPAGAGGARPLVIVGQPGRAWVAEGDVAFLDTPWWQLAARVAGEHLQYRQIARLRVEEAGGRGATFTARIGAEDAYELFLGEEPKGRRVPDELVDKAVGRAQYFTVERFVGEDLPTSRTGLDKPRLKVSWQVSRKGGAGGIPLEGPWQSFLCGKAGEGDLTHGTLSADRGLVFLLRNTELGCFQRLLDWAGQ